MSRKKSSSQFGPIKREYWARAAPMALKRRAYLAIVCMEIRGIASASSVFPQDNDRDLEVSRQAYEAALARLGPRHVATLKIENYFGWVLRWRGQSDEAIRYAKEAADGLRELKGADDSRHAFRALQLRGLLELNLNDLTKAPRSFAKS